MELNPEKLGTKSQQAAPEELKRGNGKAEMWQWKCRKVRVKRAEKCLWKSERPSGNGRVEKWQWKSRNVAMEEQKPNSREENGLSKS